MEQKGQFNYYKRMLAPDYSFALRKLCQPDHITCVLSDDHSSRLRNIQAVFSCN